MESKAMKETNYVHVDEDLLNAVSNGWYHAPHEVLGAHVEDGRTTIRVLRRLADRVFIETAEGRTEAEHEFNGIWRAVLETAEVPATGSSRSTATSKTGATIPTGSFRPSESSTSTCSRRAATSGCGKRSART